MSGRAEPAIEVEDLEKRFDTVQAVAGVSFAVARGSTCALLGGNGAGKTTTLGMLLGLLTPTRGKVTVLGTDMLARRQAILPRMNFSSPYADLPHRLTVRENLRVYAGLYGVRRARARIEALSELLEMGPLLERRYGNLSSGQKTRVSMAKALLNEPELLLLDEPTASLDPDTADRIRTLLKDYQRRTGATVLLASHNMLEVERLCDQVLMMRRGLIVDRGPPASLIGRYGRTDLEQVFLDIARGEGTGFPSVRAVGSG